MRTATGGAKLYRQPAGGDIVVPCFTQYPAIHRINRDLTHFTDGFAEMQIYVITCRIGIYLYHICACRKTFISPQCLVNDKSDRDLHTFRKTIIKQQAAFIRPVFHAFCVPGDHNLCRGPSAEEATCCIDPDPGRFSSKVGKIDHPVDDMGFASVNITMDFIIQCYTLRKVFVGKEGYIGSGCLVSPQHAPATGIFPVPVRHCTVAQFPGKNEVTVRTPGEIGSCLQFDSRGKIDVQVLDPFRILA